MWKCPNASLFHEPVDPVVWNVPDYPKIIKTPMDFGTVKQKLSNNEYLRIEQFLEDMNLVFDNCMKYNGIGS